MFPLQYKDRNIIDGEICIIIIIIGLISIIPFCIKARPTIDLRSYAIMEGCGVHTYTSWGVYCTIHEVRYLMWEVMSRSQQGESNGWDSSMVQRLIVILSNQRHNLGCYRP